MGVGVVVVVVIVAAVIVGGGGGIGVVGVAAAPSQHYSCQLCHLHEAQEGLPRPSSQGAGDTASSDRRKTCAGSDESGPLLEMLRTNSSFWASLTCALFEAVSEFQDEEPGRERCQEDVGGGRFSGWGKSARCVPLFHTRWVP